ncbi:MAG: YlmC/YmxH family sporulation protein [Clostridia bacterium]|nr:YlmC/YmxH family sporulation protein [Clostridia bacterium]
MELTYSELAKKDVINIADGRCLGRIKDAKFKFPQGVLIGIVVPARKNKGFFWFLDKSTLYIDVSKIVKIGGDVILVNISCGDNCLPNTKVGKEPPAKCPPPPPPCNPCPPHCPPKQKDNETLDLSSMFDQNGRIDLDDY